MSRHIVLWSQGPEDSVRVYTEDTVVVTTLDRKDLHIFKNLPGGEKPGIYILIGQDRRYVGQTSVSVMNRLSAHDKDRDWWDRAVVISREDGTLDKSQLDRLEAWLIEKFEGLGYSGDNIYSSPSSYIEALQRGRAKTLLDRAESILLKDAVDKEVFKRKSRKSNKTQVSRDDGFIFLTVETVSEIKIPENEETNLLISNEDAEDRSGRSISKILLKSKLYGEIESRHFRTIYSEYLRSAWPDFEKELLQKFSTVTGIMKTDSISESRKKNCFSIDDSYSFYNSFSAETVRTRVDEIALIAGDEVSIEVSYHQGLF